MHRNTSGWNQTLTQHIRGLRHRIVAVCAIAIGSVFLGNTGVLRAQSVESMVEICNTQQDRIDLIDGKKDSMVLFNTMAQNVRGKKIFFETVDRIQQNLAATTFPEKEKQPFYAALSIVLQNINKNNVRYLAYFEQYFSMVEKLSLNQGPQKDMELLKNHVLTALDCIPYFVKRSYARDVLTFAAGKKPYDVLTKYLDYNRETWFLSVLETVAHFDPNAVKQFFGTSHPVNNTLQMSKDPVVLKLYEIFQEYGRASSGYTNIELVYNRGMSIDSSEILQQNKNAWFKKLCTLRASKDILGVYSVDQELTQHSLEVIRKINLLHDEKDDVRFAIASKLTDVELYNIMVYSRDEIFTSSFLGLFNRFMQRRTDSSMYVFFQKQGWNKFRTYVQMCAGYNTMQKVLNTMTAGEKDLLIDEIVKGLETTGGNLEPAVEVADIFGSITDSTLREKMSDRLKFELYRCYANGNTYGARLYGLLFKLAGGMPEIITGKSINFDIPLLDKVEAGLLFPDNKNVQQHVFYDDEDGEAAYMRFVQQFKTAVGWKVTELAHYTRIESTKGKKIVLYCNKPQSEMGLEVLRKLFEIEKRYPDIVVHRGHSYHLTGTVDLLTNNVKIAILGSCGGYLNIARVLDNASDAQIVSSKQVGTWTVNDVLLKDMCEMMRDGTGEVNWVTLWAALDKKLKNNDKWYDYIPPYQNLGVRFVKAFESVQ